MSRTYSTYLSPSHRQSSAPTPPDSRTLSIASTIVSTNSEAETNDNSELWSQHWNRGSTRTGVSPRHAYESYISHLADRWPHLVELRNWVFRNTHTTRKPSTTILDLRENAAPIRREFPDDTGVRDNGKSYKHLAQCLKRPTPANVKGRVVVVPYLQPSLVNVLGSIFDLDPEFFSGHLGFGNELVNLSSEFLRIVYAVDLAREYGEGGVEERRISAFVQMPENESGHWTAIILFNLDQPGDITSTSTSTLTASASRCPRSFLSRAKFSRGPQPQQDLADEFVEVILDQNCEEYKLSATDPFYTLHFLFSHAAQEWATTINFLKFRWSELQNDILPPVNAHQLIDREVLGNDAISPLRSYQRKLIHYENILITLLESINSSGKPCWKIPHTKSHHRQITCKSTSKTASLHQDVSALLLQIRTILQETEHVTALLNSQYSLLLLRQLHSQQTKFEEFSLKILEILKVLAVFVVITLPLIVVVGVFGMNVDEFRPWFRGLFVITAAGVVLLVAAGAVVIVRVFGKLRAKKRDGKQCKFEMRSTKDRSLETVKTAKPR